MQERTRADDELEPDALQSLARIESRMFGGAPGSVEVDRYELQKQLGAGGMGVVYAAWDPELRRRVAVKLVHVGGAGSAGASRLLREAQAIARISHPNVIPVHDVGTYTPQTTADEPAAPSVFVVMELVDGRDLERWLEGAGRRWEETLDVFLAAGRGLAAAHAAGILHRDFKPSNVLVGDDGRVRVVDFGLARPVTSDPTEGDRRDTSGDQEVVADIHTRTGTVLGTPYYMAPELLGGGESSERSDQYAFAVALYTGLFGRGPFVRGSIESVTRAKRAGNIMPVPEDSRVPGWLAEVVWRGLAPAPEARFASMGEMLQTIEHLRHRRRRVVTGTIAVLGVGGAIAIGLGLGRLPDAAVPSPPSPPDAAVLPAQDVEVERPPVLAFLPFTGATDGELGWIANGLPNLMFEEVRDQPGVRLVPHFRLKALIGDRPAAAWSAIARQAGATILISSTVERSATGLDLHVVAEDLDGVVLVERRVHSDEPGIADVARVVAREVTSIVTGLPVDAAEDAGRPITYERALQLGVAALEQFDFETAQLHLDEARKIAPEAAEAHFYGAILADWVGRVDEAHSEYRLAAQGVLGAAKRAYIDGSLLRMKLGHAGAVEHFRRARAQYPDDIYLAYGLFEVLYHAGQGAAAVEAFEQLRSLAPSFGTGLTHVMERAAAVGDAEALRRGLEAAERAKQSDELLGIWRGRLAVLEGDLAGALAVFEPLAQTSAVALDFAVAVHAIHGDAALARARVTQAIKRGQTHMLLAELALCTANGDDACREVAVVRERSRIVRAPRSDSATTAWLHTALHEALVEGADLDAVAEATSLVVQGPIGFDLRVELTTLFIADARGDTAVVDAAAASPHPEVVEVAAAMAARRAGDHAAAAKHWRAAVGLGVESRFQIAERYQLARALRELGDDRGVVETCDAVTTPRNFSWSWGAAVGPCTLWAAEASARLGDRAGARARFERVLALRTRGGVHDALRSAARDGLATLSD